MPTNGNGKDPVLVIVQLSGGNDFMHTLIPYNSPTYYDNRKLVRIEREDVLPINDDLAFNPNFRPVKDMFDEGKVAIVQGIGYPNSNRSHFRGMDIWHTCEPDKVVTEGWVGKALRELDPKGEDEPHRHQLRLGLAPRYGGSRRPRHIRQRPGTTTA